jgi:hypothetical protein
MIYALAFCAVVLLDTLCVRFIFPLFPGVVCRVNLAQAFAITAVSAFLIGIIFLEGVGGLLVYPVLQGLGLPQKLAYVLVKNAYLTLSPLLSGIALLMWTRSMPALGFYRLWPDALMAGLLLDFIDHGIIVPWFFRLAEVLSR